MIGEQSRWSRAAREQWAIWLSLALALTLSVMPLPGPLVPFRPDLTALWVVFWTLTLPEQVGMASAWLAGLLQGALYGSTLGVDALALTFLAFLTERLHLRLRMFPRWQQTVAVLVLIVLAHVVVMIARQSLGLVRGNLAYWLSAATSAILWPVVWGLLQTLRRSLKLV